MRHSNPVEMLCLTSETIAIALFYRLFTGLHCLHMCTPLPDSNIHDLCATNDLPSPACKLSAVCAGPVDQDILQ